MLNAPRGTEGGPKRRRPVQLFSRQRSTPASRYSSLTARGEKRSAHRKSMASMALKPTTFVFPTGMSEGLKDAFRQRMGDNYVFCIGCNGLIYINSECIECQPPQNFTKIMAHYHAEITKEHAKEVAAIAAAAALAPAATTSRATRRATQRSRRWRAAHVHVGPSRPAPSGAACRAGLAPRRLCNYARFMERPLSRPRCTESG